MQGIEASSQRRSGKKYAPYNINCETKAYDVHR